MKLCRKQAARKRQLLLAGLSHASVLSLRPVPLCLIVCNCTLLDTKLVSLQLYFANWRNPVPNRWCKKLDCCNCSLQTGATLFQIGRAKS